MKNEAVAVGIGRVNCAAVDLMVVDPPLILSLDLRYPRLGLFHARHGTGFDTLDIITSRSEAPRSKLRGNIQVHTSGRRRHADWYGSWREYCLRIPMTTFRVLYNAEDGSVLQHLTCPDDENCEVGTTKVALAVMEGFE